MASIQRQYIVLAFAVATIIWAGRPSSALTITNGATTLFFDEFDDDVLGAVPILGVGDTGVGYNQLSGTTANTDVEHDATSATLESRNGHYLNIANDALENGRLIAQFANQSSGTVSATFNAAVVGAANGGSLRVAFTNNTNHVSGLHSGYLATGFWLENQAQISLPAGVDSNDVVMAYYDGSSYQVLSADGGTPAQGAAIDGEGLWHTVTLSQAPTIGSLPQYSLNGIPLEPVPLNNSVGIINGLEFGSNGGDQSQAYVDGEDGVIVPGDVTGDGVVDILDFNVIKMNFGMIEATRMQGDLTSDGIVGLPDFKEWKNNVPAAGEVVLPEPCSGGLLVIGAWIMFASGFGRRRGPSSRMCLASLKSCELDV